MKFTLITLVTNLITDILIFTPVKIRWFQKKILVFKSVMYVLGIRTYSSVKDFLSRDELKKYNVINNSEKL